MSVKLMKFGRFFYRKFMSLIWSYNDTHANILCTINFTELKI